MVKKCPPGVFCIENYTLSVLALIIIGFLLYLWKNSNASNYNGGNTNASNSKNNNINNNPVNQLTNRIDSLITTLTSNTNNNIVHTRPDSIFTTNNSVLLNPYVPPNRDDRPFINSNNLDPRGMPINIRTQGVESTYRQVGILTRINGSETILPLMGRPLIAGRDTWNFYTMSDKNNMVKLPVTFKNKNCSNEYGCDNVSNGDTVYVEGYNDAFRVTVYENNTMRYIPYI